MKDIYWVTRESVQALHEHNVAYKIDGYDFAAAPQCYRIIVSKDYVEQTLSILRGESL